MEREIPESYVELHNDCVPEPGALAGEMHEERTEIPDFTRLFNGID